MLQTVTKCLYYISITLGAWDRGRQMEQNKNKSAVINITKKKKAG